MKQTLRVIAVGEARVPFVDELGRLRRGSFVGRNPAGEPAEETVPDLPYLRTAINHGDLREIDDAPPATPTATENPQ